jgi:hypothetical protein
MSLERKRQTFYLIARYAIDDGLLTAKERDFICRKGTRKAGYWARHVRNLLEVLAERQRQRDLSVITDSPLPVTDKSGDNYR